MSDKNDYVNLSIYPARDLPHYPRGLKISTGRLVSVYGGVSQFRRPPVCHLSRNLRTLFQSVLDGHLDGWLVEHIRAKIFDQCDLYLNAIGI